MIYALRPYQTDAKNVIREHFIAGTKRVVLCQPTGSGKTVTFADIARESVKNGFRIMVVVDRAELLLQTKEKLVAYGLNPSLITAGKTARKRNASYIATVQTLVRRELPDVDLIIIDEAHKQIFDKILEKPEYKDVYVIGATATPHRTGRMTQLSKNYDVMVETVTIHELIQLGFLVPAITYGAKVDTSKIKTKGHDFDTASMFDAFNKSTLYAGVVEKYNKFARGTKAIVFNINVEHSKKVTQAFLNAGISAAHIDGTTPKSERKRILKAFSMGAILVLNNVDVLTTGYDEWTIETVIVNRATKSLPLWLQMCGRGSRITPIPLQGNRAYLQKEHFNLIDMGGNVFSLGFWEQEREFSLKHKTKDTIDPAPVRICPEDKYDSPTDEIIEYRAAAGMPKNIMGCGAILHASAPNCKFCGFVFDRSKKAPKEAEFIQLENYESLPEELIGKAFGSMNFEELEKVKSVRGYKFGWLVKQIIMREDLQLVDYAVYKKYKYPAQWVGKMEQMYIKKP
ncbi:DEAD/DEAH box helicase [Candidatus Babeliales bacterium]|nr:DEAD/DEAH box helicase [Candidatus Babeliales bacterium]